MAKVINVSKKETSTLSSGHKKTKEDPKPPLFRKVNYILMIVGILFLGVGYILLSGGGSKDPAQFSEAIFDTRRLVIAPILILIGLITEIFAIMWHPKPSEER